MSLKLVIGLSILMYMYFKTNSLCTSKCAQAIMIGQWHVQISEIYCTLNNSLAYQRQHRLTMHEDL